MIIEEKNTAAADEDTEDRPEECRGGGERMCRAAGNIAKKKEKRKGKGG